jgi:hypothetical protein
MAEHRVMQRCDGDILIVECADHGGLELLMHVDIRRFSDGRYLGVWSIEAQQALEGLLLTEAIVDCLKRLTFMRS